MLQIAQSNPSGYDVSEDLLFLICFEAKCILMNIELFVIGCSDLCLIFKVFLTPARALEIDMYTTVPPFAL